MWTAENRKRYDRSQLRYPSDLTDDEWKLIEPLIAPAKRGGRRREVNVREVMNGVMYVLSTGCQWRAIPKDCPPRARCSPTWIYGATTARWSVYITSFMSDAASRRNVKRAPQPPSSIVKA